MRTELQGGGGAKIDGAGQQLSNLTPTLARGFGRRRNRYAACKIAGVEPEFEELPKDVNPLAAVVSLNVKRRNLTASQRAVAAAQAWRTAMLEGRVLVGRGGDRSKAKSSLLIADPREYFGKLFGVNEKYAEMALELYTEDPLWRTRCATARSI
jgi:hypothetical protein